MFEIHVNIYPTYYAQHPSKTINTGVSFSDLDAATFYVSKQNDLGAKDFKTFFIKEI